MADARQISLRGVRVHNLKAVDLDIPRGKLIVFCGVSGSGKSSLALDTLYAEGQRRYIESFSAYTRQFLDRLEKPDAERIDGMSPAIAVTRREQQPIEPLDRRHCDRGVTTICGCCSPRSAESFCRQCGREVLRHTPQSVAAELAQLPAGTRFMVAFRLVAGRRRSTPSRSAAASSKRDLSARSVGEQIVELANIAAQSRLESAAHTAERPQTGYIVVDRLTAGSTADERLRDTLETAFDKGRGQACFASKRKRPPRPIWAARSVTIDGQRGGGWP